MSYHPPDSSGLPWPNIVNDNHNYNYNPGGNIFNNNPVNNYIVVPETTPDTTAIIEKALGQHHFPGAMFEAQSANAGCMLGTRVQFLAQVLALLTGRTGPHIAWIAGMAGTGKTSIALTLCRILWEDSSVFLGGSFFCSRSTGTVERTDVQRIVPTLATILAREYPAYASALARQLEEQPDIAHWSVRTQVERLLTIPLDVLGWRDGQIVFVIDALDECSDQRKLSELIDALADFKSAFPVKFLLTSRPEMYIRKTPISNPNLSSILQLHTVNPAHVAADIRLYILETLATASGTAIWYSQYDVEALVQRSGGLFIFASTALRYILDRSNDEGRRDRLRKATNILPTTASTAPLDQIYELVLTEASRPDKVDDDELEDTRRILACILTARASLSVRALAELITVSPASLRGALDRLPSLVHVPDSDDELGIRTLHASFGDYMFDRAASNIRIATALGHDILARGCLGRMGQDDLCFNVSRSRSSFEPNSDVTPDYIPLSLLYACLHWAHHLCAVSNSSIIDEEVGRILQQKLLFWLEVLSITGEMGVASGLLRIAGSTVKQPAVVHFLRDAISFVVSSYDAIERSAPHIYLSALSFVPKDSLIYECFASRCTGVVSVETVNIDRHGGSLAMTLTGHQRSVNSVAYSQNGRLLVSGFSDGTVRIWDTRTGEETTTPMDVGAVVLAVMFVLEDKSIAVCADDGSIRILDIATGGELFYRLLHCYDEINSAAFSPDGMAVAVHANGGKTSLWNTATGEEIFTLEAVPKDRFHCSIRFSPEGYLAALPLRRGFVCSWNRSTGLDLDHLVNKDRYAQCFAISPDGMVLAAGLMSDGIELWDLATPSKAPMVLKYEGSPDHLMFSPDGSRLAVVYGKSICFWDWHTKQMTGTPLQGHSTLINNFSYSPDGLYIASADLGGTVRIWDVGDSQAVVQPLPAYSGIYSTAVSSDCALVVSGHNDGSLRAWDAQNGEVKLQLQVGQGHPVKLVAISSDKRWIASWSDPGSVSDESPLTTDRAVRLWDGQTGEIKHLLEWYDTVVKFVALEFSPDQQLLASVSHEWTRRFGTVHGWNLGTQTSYTLGTFRCTSQPRRALVAFSPDGQLLIVSADSETHIWQMPSCQRVRNFRDAEGRIVISVAFSRNGTQIVSGTADGMVQIRAISSGQLLSTHTDDSGIGLGLGPVLQVACSSDARFMTRLYDGLWNRHEILAIWDTEKPGVVAQIRGTGQRLAFTTDGQSVIESGGGAIRVWRVESLFALASRSQCDPLAQLLRRGTTDGWVTGPDGELLLWIPLEYCNYVQLSPCTLLIDKYRVIITADESGLHYGENWTSCWRQGA